MSDITLQRGEYANKRITVTKSGTAFDLTGSTVRMVIRNDGYPAGTTSDDTGAVLVKTVGSGITLTDPTNGIMDIEFARADTNTLEFSTTRRQVELIYSIEVIPDGYTSSVPLLDGLIIVTPDIVRTI